MRTNKKYNADEKFGHVQKYLNGNKTIEAYTIKEGITRSTFYKWLKAYREKNTFTDITPQIKETILKPIVLNPSKVIKISLPTGISIETELQYLKEIIRLLND